MKKSRRRKNSNSVWELKIAGLKIQALGELIGNQVDVSYSMDKRNLDWALGLILTSIGKKVESVGSAIEESELRKIGQPSLPFGRGRGKISKKG